MLQQGLRYLSGGGSSPWYSPLQREQPHVAAIRGAVAGLIEGATRVFPTNVRVNGVIPSRDPVGEEHDRSLVRVAVALGSMVSEGVRGRLPGGSVARSAPPTRDLRSIEGAAIGLSEERRC